jgi:predicted ATP-dependent serine protease
MAWWRCKKCKGPPFEGGQYEKPWVGQCPHCGRYSNGERLGGSNLDEKGKSKFMTSSSEIEDVAHIPTGIEGYDAVTGGGLVAGCVVLLGGEEGAGKTSLAQMLVNGIAKKKRTALYISAEQPGHELIRIQRRLGIENENVKMLGSTSNIHMAIEACIELKPIVAVFDSIPMMTIDDGNVGSRTQGEQVLNVIQSHCKKSGMCAIAINHLGADGFFKGSTMLRYMADSLIYLDKIFATEADWDRRTKSQLKSLVGFEKAAHFSDVSGLRQLISGKNRTAPESQKAYFEMTKAGILVGVKKNKESLIERVRVSGENFHE